MQNTQAEQVTTPQPATWWTKSGFISGQQPPDYATQCATAEGNWDKILEAAGYEEQCSQGSEFDPMTAKAWIHSGDKHLFVELWNIDSGQGSFFVTSEDTSAFMATWWLDFLYKQSIAVISTQMQRIAKTLVAFVRHDHGEHVIDENGEMSYDDRRRWQESQRAKIDKVNFPKSSK